MGRQKFSFPSPAPKRRIEGKKPFSSSPHGGKARPIAHQWKRCRKARTMMSLLQRLKERREISVVIVLVVISILLCFTSARDTFYSQRNLQNLLLQIALLATFAIGETIVIITGGIDLSLGSII